MYKLLLRSLVIIYFSPSLQDLLPVLRYSEVFHLQVDHQKTMQILLPQPRKVLVGDDSGNLSFLFSSFLASDFWRLL